MTKITEAAPVRIVIVDDHPVVVRGLREFLDDEPGFEVVGVADGKEEFLRIVQEKKPDIALVDLKLSGNKQEDDRPSGIGAVEQSQKLVSCPRCIVYSAYPQYGPEAIRAGASAYVLKDTPMDRLVEVIRDVLDDKFVAPREVIMALRKQEAGLNEGAESLTRREMEVLREWVSRPGATREAIALALDIKPGTVRTHLRNIYRKLGVQSRTEAVLKAQKLGLV